MDSYDFNEHKLQKQIGYYMLPWWAVHKVFMEYQAVAQGKNKLPHAKYTLDPKYIFLTDLENPLTPQPPLLYGDLHHCKVITETIGWAWLEVLTYLNFTARIFSTQWPSCPYLARPLNQRTLIYAVLYWPGIYILLSNLPSTGKKMNIV